MQCNIDKSYIRKQVLAERKKLRKFEVRENSEEIFEKFVDLNIKCTSAMCYLDFNNEVETAQFIAFFKTNNIDVSVPVCDKDVMHAAKFMDTEPFKISKLGVLEPEFPKLINPGLIDLCIIPGVAFDIYGNRVGYGKGYYDKFLCDKKIIKIGICHDFQIYDNPISNDTHDVKMDYIITEKRIICL